MANQNPWHPSQALIILALFALLSSFFTTGCDILKLQDAITKFEERSDTIGMEITEGALMGLNSSNLDSIISRLVGVAGNSLKGELDSLSLQKLSDSLHFVVMNVLTEGLDSLEGFLQDSTSLDVLDAKIQSMIASSTSKLESSIAQLIPNALNEENLAQIYELRDSLLGPTTAQLINQAITGSIKELINSEELEELTQKVNSIVTENTEKVDESLMGVSRTAERIGLIIGGIILLLALLFLFLWLRKRSLAKQQNELVLNLTKAIDAIPNQAHYDHTIAVLHQQMNNRNATQQHELLNKVLQENAGQYVQKKKYKDHYKRMLQELKNS